MKMRDHFKKYCGYTLKTYWIQQNFFRNSNSCCKAQNRGSVFTVTVEIMTCVVLSPILWSMFLCLKNCKTKFRLRLVQLRFCIGPFNFIHRSFPVPDFNVGTIKCSVDLRPFAVKFGEITSIMVFWVIMFSGSERAYRYFGATCLFHLKDEFNFIEINLRDLCI